MAKYFPRFPAAAIHIMLDLETASTANDAAIVQIGAITEAGQKFTCYVSLASCEQNGFDVSLETMDLWARQDPAVRNRVFSGDTPINVAVTQFLDWAEEQCGGDWNRIVLWGNGCEFDNVILKTAVERFFEWPFSPRNNHSLRTISCLTPIEIQREADEFAPAHTPHDALSDAHVQMSRLKHFLNYFEGPADDY